MKTIYQIVAKGISTNAIRLFETTSFLEQKSRIKNLENSGQFIILTTNIYRYG